MAEPARRGALHGCLEHQAGPGAPGSLRVTECRPRALVQIMGAPPADDLARCLAPLGLQQPPAPGRCAGNAALRLLWTGPDQYLAVSDDLAPESLSAVLAQQLQGLGGALADLSHGRTVLRIEGGPVHELLAKGCPLDLESMSCGDVAATVLSHFNVLLHCDGSNGFQLFVTRSFGLACVEWLRVAGAEFAVTFHAAAAPPAADHGSEIDG